MVKMSARWLRRWKAAVSPVQAAGSPPTVEECVRACVMHADKLKGNRDGRRWKLARSIRALPRPGRESPEALHKALLEVGNRALAVGADAEDTLALLVADALLGVRRSSRAAWRLRARALERVGNDRAAIVACQRYLALAREDSTDAAARISRLRERLDRVERTLRSLRKQHPEARGFSERPDTELWAEGLALLKAGDAGQAWPRLVAALVAAATHGRPDHQVRAALADFERLRLGHPGAPEPEAGEAVLALPEGGHRVAFASYVDENYLPGFLVLLRSLALTNPHVCEDFIVFYDDLSPASVTRILQLHPRVVFRRVEVECYASYVKRAPEHYQTRKSFFILDAFRIRDYDTVITLDTDMVVLGDLSELLKPHQRLAAVPQFFKDHARLNSGLMVIPGDYLTDDFCARIDAVGRAGSYEIEKHDQGILNALLENEFTRLDPVYNFVKRRIPHGSPVPEGVVVLHFTGRHKPWNGGEHGYEEGEAVWHRFDVPDQELASRFLELSGEKHPDLVLHFSRQTGAELTR